MTDNKKFEIRAASSPIVQNNTPLVGSLWDNGLCPRVGYLRFNGIEKPVDEKSQYYFTAGVEHEETYLKRLAEQGIETEYQDKQVFELTPNITFGGSPDVVIKSTGEVIELKSVHSPNSYKSKFKKGFTGADWSHTTQLAKYLVMMDAPKGRIVYTSYAEGHEGEEREVEVSYDGQTVIGGGHEIDKIWLKDGLDVMVRQLETDILHPDMPIVKPDPRQDVCTRCPLNKFCYAQLGKVKGKELQKFAVEELNWGPRAKV